MIDSGEPGENAPTPQPALNELAIFGAELVSINVAFGVSKKFVKQARNSALCIIRAGIAHIIMLEMGVDDRDPCFVGLLFGGSTPGSALNCGSLERSDRIRCRQRGLLTSAKSAVRIQG